MSLSSIIMSAVLWTGSGVPAMPPTMLGSSPSAVVVRLLFLQSPSDKSSEKSEDKSAAQNDNPAANDETTAAKDESAKSSAKPAGLSEQDRERVAVLQRAIEGDEERLKELKAQLAEPEGEYAEAQSAFKQIDPEFAEKKKQYEKLKADGDEAAAAAIEKDVQSLETLWKLSKKRLELAIKEREILENKITALDRKNQQDRKELLLLLGGDAPSQKINDSARTTATTDPAPAQSQSQESTAPAGASAPMQAGSPASAASKSGTAGITSANPLGVPLPSAGGTTSVKPAQPLLPPSPELVKARQEAHQKIAATEAAKADARSIAGRMELMRAYLKAEMDWLATARQKEDNALRSRLAIEEELQQRVEANAPQEQIEKLQQQRDEQERLFQQANSRVTETTKRLNELQAELSGLLPQKNQAQQRVAEKQREADAALDNVRSMENPFALHNVLYWLTHHGPRLLGIVVITALLLWLGNFLEKRLIDLMTRRAERGGRKERETRAETLVGVCHNAAKVMIVFWGITMFVSELGINIGVVMGSAAVLGLAVAFGAQNLIRDYFYGFVILLEYQYKVNDVVRICNVGGVVERFTLRITALRDEDGTLHFIPNGQITTVSNKTHGWSRAVFAIPIDYQEDADHVMQVLMEIGTELRQDPEYALLIMDDPEMLGVDDLAESSVILKFFIKTRPMKQWKVKREMLRRIKRRFDELRIEIPLPQRIVYQRRQELKTESGHENHSFSTATAIPSTKS